MSDQPNKEAREDAPIPGIDSHSLPIDFNALLTTILSQLAALQEVHNAQHSNITPVPPLQVLPIDIDNASPFPLFVATTINSLDTSRAAFSGYLMPTPLTAYLARQYENYQRLHQFDTLEATTANITTPPDQLFIIPPTSLDYFLYPCPETILTSPYLEIFLNLYKKHTILFYQAIQQPQINAYQLIPALQGSLEHSNNIFRTFSLLQNPLLNSKFYSVYPASPAELRKRTQSTTILIRETWDLYKTIHEPYINSILAQPDSLKWLYDILDGKKESSTVLLNIRDDKFDQALDQIDQSPSSSDNEISNQFHGSSAFIMAKDTKWGAEFYNDALEWYELDQIQQQELKKHQELIPANMTRCMSYHSTSLPLPSFPPELPCPIRNKLPTHLAKPIWCLAFPMDRSLHTIRDLNHTHLPLLRSMRKEILHYFYTKFNIPATELVLYYHYTPTFYHLHLHINHVSLITEATYTGKVEELGTVINNIEMVPDYYQRCIKLFNISETHQIAANFKHFHAANNNQGSITSDDTCSL